MHMLHLLNRSLLEVAVHGSKINQEHLCALVVPKLDLIDENQVGFAVEKCKAVNRQILPQMLQHEAIIWLGPLLKLPLLAGPVFELVLKQWLDATCISQ